MVSIEERKRCKILLVGVGGLGSEILKCLLFSGFTKIDVVDNDIVEISNLSRQVFYKQCDVGEPKAIVLAKNIKNLFKSEKNLEIRPFNNDIEELIGSDGINFKEYDFVLSGLDNIQGRRLLNANLFVNRDENKKTQIFIESGTEGLNGHARVIIPNHTSCYECTLNLNTEEVNYPLCEIKECPRTPVHCIAYAIFVYEQLEEEIKSKSTIAEDKMEKISRINDIALKHANSFGIKGVNIDLTERIVGSITPTPLSTNAIIASYVVSQLINLISLIYSSQGSVDSQYNLTKNYFLFYGESGIYCSCIKFEKDQCCIFCS